MQCFAHSPARAACLPAQQGPIASRSTTGRARSGPMPTPARCKQTPRGGASAATGTSRPVLVLQCARAGWRVGPLEGWCHRSKGESVGARWSLGFVGGQRTIGADGSRPLRTSACQQGNATNGCAHEPDEKKRHDRIGTPQSVCSVASACVPGPMTREHHRSSLPRRPPLRLASAAHGPAISQQLDWRSDV
jgi:hypothetical protein